MISEGQKGWIASIIEIRGRVYQAKRPGGWSQRGIRVNIAEPGPVAALCKLTGATPITLTPREAWMRRACAEHCPEAHVHRWDVPNSLRWEMQGVPLAVVLDNCMPYFQLSSASMEGLVSEIWLLKKSSMRHQAISKSIERLRILGWDLRAYREEMAA